MIAFAFVLHATFQHTNTPANETDGVASAAPPVETVLGDLNTLLAIPISEGDDDLDAAINDATSMIAFSDMTFSDLESDLAAIEKALQQQ